MARLVRVDLKIDAHHVDKEYLQKLANIAEVIALEAGYANFRTPVDVDLTLQEGSVKVVAIVTGLLFGGYHFIADYKDFREGIQLIYSDAEHFAHAFSDRFLTTAGIPNSQVSSRKIDLQTPGRLAKAFEELERVNEEKAVTRPIQSANDRLAIARINLAKAFKDLDPEERAQISKIPPLTSLHATIKWPELVEESQREVGESKPKSDGPMNRLAPPLTRARPVPKLKIKRKIHVNPSKRLGR